MFEKAPKQGTIVLEKGKCMLKAGKEQMEIPADVVEMGDVRKLVGQRVEILYTKPQRSIVGLRPFRRPPIGCYVPLPPMRPGCYITFMPGEAGMAEVVRSARKDLIEQLVKDKVITQAAYRKLIRKPTCYIPARDFIARVSEDVRRDMANRMLAEKIIPKAVHAKLVK